MASPNSHGNGCSSRAVSTSGKAGPVDQQALAEAVGHVCADLAFQLAGDAEGATKVVKLTVTGAADLVPWGLPMITAIVAVPSLRSTTVSRTYNRGVATTVSLAEAVIAAAVLWVVTRRRAARLV